MTLLMIFGTSDTFDNSVILDNTDVVAGDEVVVVVVEDVVVVVVAVVVVLLDGRNVVDGDAAGLLLLK